MKPFTKHFSIIFKFPWRFKRNLIHMLLIHLHSVHKNCSSVWSHCGPEALKKLSNEPSFLNWNPDDFQMFWVLSVLSKFGTWRKKKSLGHEWESTDGSGTLWGKKMPIIGILLKVKETISFVKISFDRWTTLCSLKNGRPLPRVETEWSESKLWVRMSQESTFQKLL